MDMIIVQLFFLNRNDSSVLATRFVFTITVCATTQAAVQLHITQWILHLCFVFSFEVLNGKWQGKMRVTVCWRELLYKDQDDVDGNWAQNNLVF